MQTETVRVKPWGKGQGEFVDINKADFDPSRHVLFEPAVPKPEPKKQERKR